MPRTDMKSKFVRQEIIFVFLLAVLTITPSVHGQSTAKLSPAQRQAAIESIQIMRRLASALELGPSFPQYTDRLIEVKIAIEERLVRVPKNPTYFFISRALSAFTDAHEVWRLALTQNSPQSYIIYACHIFEKYNVRVHTIPPGGCRDANTISEAVPYGALMHLWRNRILDPQLAEIWSIAITYLVKADQELSSR